MSDLGITGLYDIMDAMSKDKKPRRKTMPKAALARLCFIDEQIASGNFPSTAWLAENCGNASLSTIGRDISFMKNILNAPIKYDVHKRGFYYSKPKYRVPLGFYGGDELLALGMVKALLVMYKDTPIYDTAFNQLKNITTPVDLKGNSDWYENRIVVPPPPSAPVEPDMWEAIITALRENRILSFDSNDNGDRTYINYRFCSYQLLFDNGLWYLYGQEANKNNTRIFSLSRMKNVMVAKGTFRLPNKFDYRSIFGGGRFGVSSGISSEEGFKKQHYKIAFKGKAVDWVKERKWADDQEITETEDEVIITFTSSHFDKVFEWMLSRGYNARPLEPNDLVRVWRMTIKALGMKK
jgi:predicted DNA-binding transcriptional regulator YafY